MSVALLAKPAPKPAVALTEIRCPVCGKLLLRAHLAAGSVIEPFCDKCKRPRLIVAA